MIRFGAFLKTARQQGFITAVLRTRFVRPRIWRAAELIYWHDYTWTTTTWFGVPILKYPADAWTYQEIIFDTRPDLIIETGTAHGGSALFFASLLDLQGRGQVVTIDILAGSRPVHPRVHYISGSSVSEDTLALVRDFSANADRVMVVLDSDHSEKHVYAELMAYHKFVTVGCYLVVEDTNINGHPVYKNHGPGPMEALAKFLPDHSEFQSDPFRERLGLTAHPNGFLRRHT
jgi:cephalosporin hydroxylase